MKPLETWVYPLFQAVHHPRDDWEPDRGLRTPRTIEQLQVAFTQMVFRGEITQADLTREVELLEELVYGGGIMWAGPITVSDSPIENAVQVKSYTVTAMARRPATYTLAPWMRVTWFRFDWSCLSFREYPSGRELIPLNGGESVSVMTMSERQAKHIQFALRLRYGDALEVMV